jgi:hypothetical protein
VKQRTALALATLIIGTAHAQTTPRVNRTVTSDPAQIVRLLRGDVTLIGSSFPNITFQKGVLTNLRSRAITKLTLLTTQEQLKNMVPLRAAGAAVYYLPVGGVNMTGNMALVGSSTVIVQQGARTWTIYRAEQMAAQVRGSLNTYLTHAKKF